MRIVYWKPELKYIDNIVSTYNKEEPVYKSKGLYFSISREVHERGFSKGIIYNKELRDFQINYLMWDVGFAIGYRF